MSLDADADGAGSRRLPILCECSDLACERVVPLTADEYRRLAARGWALALAPGHVLVQRLPPHHPRRDEDA
jgi:hypothetical protein